MTSGTIHKRATRPGDTHAQQDVQKPAASHRDRSQRCCLEHRVVTHDRERQNAATPSDAAPRNAASARPRTRARCRRLPQFLRLPHRKESAAPAVQRRRRRDRNSRSTPFPRDKGPPRRKRRPRRSVGKPPARVKQDPRRRIGARRKDVRDPAKSKKRAQRHQDRTVVPVTGARPTRKGVLARPMLRG